MIEKTDTLKSILTGVVRSDFLLEETLVDLFQQTCDKYPTKTALIFQDTQLSYHDLQNWSNAIAADLVQKGIGNGCYVGVWLPRGLALHAVILGIVKAGAAYVPIDNDMPAERVSIVLKEVHASAYFTTNYLEASCTILPVVPLPINGAKTPNINVAIPDGDAYVLYTSGSTGIPKGIPITHRKICHLVRAEQSVFDIKATDRVYQGFSVSFDMWCEETWISYFVGATLWVADNTTSKAIDELSDVLSAQKITVLHAVPSLLAVIDDIIPSIRIVNAGGEACTSLVVNKWAKKGVAFYNSYGPTETTVSATIAALQPGDRITIGEPLPNYAIAVVDEMQQLLPRGERGELIISGAGVSNGYVNLTEQTAKKFLPKPPGLKSMPGNTIYLTGDAAIINEDGSVDFLGRFDDQIKLRGYRIELGEIEVKLQAFPNITAVAVAVKKDLIGNEHLIGYLLPASGITIDEYAIRVALAKTLPTYMVPEAIVLLKEIPRMPSGKINRKQLPEPDFFNHIVADGQEIIDINAPLDNRMVAALKKTFPGKEIHLSQDFFTDLGGHSLLAAGFVSRLRQEGGVPNASLKDIYIHRPLQALADVWQATSQNKTAIKPPFNPIAKWRYYGCWAAQTISLFLVFSLFAVEVFGPYFSYYFFSEEYENYLNGMLAATVF